MKHGQDARATCTCKGFCKSLFIVALRLKVECPPDQRTNPPPSEQHYSIIFRFSCQRRARDRRAAFTRPGAPPFPLPRLHGESYGTRIRRMADLGTKIRGWIQSPEQGRGPLIQARLKDVWTIGHYAVGVPGSPRSPSAKQAPRPFFHPIVAANQSTTDQDAVAKPALMLNINSRTLCSWELPAFGCKLNFRWQRLFVRPVPLTAAPTRCGRRGGRRRGEAPGNR